VFVSQCILYLIQINGIAHFAVLHSGTGWHAKLAFSEIDFSARDTFRRHCLNSSKLLEFKHPV